MRHTALPRRRGRGDPRRDLPIGTVGDAGLGMEPVGAGMIAPPTVHARVTAPIGTMPRDGDDAPGTADGPVAIGRPTPRRR